MFSKGDSGAGAILFTAALIGLVVAYWFYEASQFPSGNKINLTHTSFMPVVCYIASDRAADPKQAAQVYFLQGNIRIDVQSISLGAQTLQAHQIVKNSGASYLWRDDRPVGEVANNVTDYPILSQIATTNSWFCFPWIFLDYSKFTPPKEVTFQ